MSKIDFKKSLKHLYNPPKKFSLVEVPEMQFLMIDGEGDPNQAQEYQDALEAFYAVAYKLKFPVKNSWRKIIQFHLWKGSGGRTIWIPSPSSVKNLSGSGR